MANLPEGFSTKNQYNLDRSKSTCPYQANNEYGTKIGP